jgi:hypothetical protein
MTSTVAGRCEVTHPTPVARLAELTRAGLFPVVRVDGVHALVEVAPSGNTQWLVEFTPLTGGDSFSRVFCNTAVLVRVEWP